MTKQYVIDTIFLTVVVLAFTLCVALGTVEVYTDLWYDNFYRICIALIDICDGAMVGIMLYNAIIFSATIGETED